MPRPIVPPPLTRNRAPSPSYPSMQGGRTHMNNTLKVLIVYVICLLVGQAGAVGLGLLADSFSNVAGIAIFIPVYYAMYWIAWRAALAIADRSPERADDDGKRGSFTTAAWLLAPATLALDLAD